jgi:hypothetical protein
VSDAEAAFVAAVARAVLDWAGLDEEEAEAPDYETINVPNRVAADLIGEKALARFREKGVGLSVAGRS